MLITFRHISSRYFTCIQGFYQITGLNSYQCPSYTRGGIKSLSIRVREVRLAIMEFVNLLEPSQAVLWQGWQKVYA